jgi:Peptidase family M28
MRNPSWQLGRFPRLVVALGLGFAAFLASPPGVSRQKAASPLAVISARTGLLLQDDAVIRLIQTSSGDLAYDTVSQLALWDRSQATEGYSTAAKWIAQRAADFGLEKVSTERFPTDGKIEYFGERTPPQWQVKEGELWLTKPFSMKITSFDDLPMSLAEASTTADVEAELVDIGMGTADADYASGVRGKIVLTSSNPLVVFDRAVIREGALGIVSSWSVPDFDRLNRRPGDFPDQVGWPRIPGKVDESPGHFAFVISERRAQELRALMRQGKTLLVHAVVDARLVPGHLEVVTGLIPGSVHPDEEIIVTAHLDHYKPGANDNASGSAAILEMARTIGELIKNKELPSPLRTIRFMWVPEYSGTYAWMSAHLSDPVKRVANLNFDMVGENVLKTNSLLNLNYTSDSNPSFLNAVLESVVEFVNRFNDERYPPQMDLYVGSVTGSRNRLSCRMVPYTTGTDHEIFNNLKIGASTLGAWPDDYYHSSEDTPDKVDPTQLHRAVVIGLAAMTTVAYADDEHAPDLARLALIYGRRRIAGSRFSAMRSLLTAPPENFLEAERSAGNLLLHVFSRERAAIASAAVFARTAKARGGIQETISLLDDDEEAARKEIDRLAGLIAVGGRPARAPRPLTDEEKRAARLVFSRNEGKELFNLGYVARRLADDPTAQIPKLLAALDEASRLFRANGESELRLFGFADAPAFYVDGRRSLLEIRDAMAAEYAPVPLEALELYFRAFEKAGVMRILVPGKK